MTTDRRVLYVEDDRVNVLLFDGHVVNTQNSAAVTAGADPMNGNTSGNW